MSLKKKIILFVFVLTAFVLCFSFAGFAASSDESHSDKLYYDDSGLLIVSHRGDTASYPENSLEGIVSALKKGADFVSVSVMKNADGVFYLCEDDNFTNVCGASYASLSEASTSECETYFLRDTFGNETECKLVSLQRLLESFDDGDRIILDVKYSDFVSLLEYLRTVNSSDVVVRTDKGTKKLMEAARTVKGDIPKLISVYEGNFIFSTISNINVAYSYGNLAAVNYRSKNYFNVCFGDFFTGSIVTDDDKRMIASTYSPDLCGQRSDGPEGWDELISKGYSVIETNNVSALVSYRAAVETLEKDIAALLKKSKAYSYAGYSSVSVDNLRKAQQACQAVFEGYAASLDEASQAYSSLVYALKQMKLSDGKVDTRGALNVTFGKVVVSALVGAGILCGQIYVYKMRRKKES